LTIPSSIWITGTALSGKTQTLVESFVQAQAVTKPPIPQQTLVFCAIGDNRPELVDRLAIVAPIPLRVVTPLGFVEDEVMLFWPWLMEKLDLKVPFPLRLRPENEQELAAELWGDQLKTLDRDRVGLPIWRLVRRILDLMQLAALSLTPLPRLPSLLQTALGENAPELPLDYNLVTELLTTWEKWCLDRGLLTYSLTAQIYGQHLLPSPEYQEKRLSRYPCLLADDLDEYPPLMGKLFTTLLDRGTQGIFTFNPQGAVRQGLGADPAYLEQQIAPRCGQRLDLAGSQGLAPTLASPILTLIDNPLQTDLLPQFTSLQTTTRAELIRQTAEAIYQSVESGLVKPQEIAILGPGLDPISRYAFTEILSRRNIEVHLLNDQRPLSSTPLVRALLTLLRLVYPNQGDNLGPTEVAEMLVALGDRLDPVRAGLISDHCFQVDRDHPQLAKLEKLPRWDRIGSQAAEQYAEITQWIAQAQEQLAKRQIANPVVLLDRAIQKFFHGGGDLPIDQMTDLRELMETAQHYWTVEGRLPGRDPNSLGRFIEMLLKNTVTANPFPVDASPNAVILSTIFQYRASRLSHPWQFWFDGGSSRWLSGVDGMFGAAMFLSDWPGEAFTIERSDRLNEQRLHRMIQDLLGRTSSRVILCYSELGTNGQEQLGPLCALTHISQPWSLDL
jgi:hypothetical protein